MSRLIAALVAVVLVLIAPAAILSWYLSTGLQRDLRAEEATVRVLAGPIGIATGRVGRLAFRVRGAAIDGVTVREFSAELHGVRLDRAQGLRGRLEVAEVAGGRAAVVVDEGDVQRYLAQAKDLRDARVHLDNGAVAVTGTVAVLNATVNVEINARLAIQDGTALVLHVETLKISGTPIPADVATILMSGVNPLLRAPREPVALRFTGVTVDGGRAVIVGEPRP